MYAWSANDLKVYMYAWSRKRGRVELDQIGARGAL